MNAESWAHLLSIIGGVLLSVELFKSPQEDKDEASAWWGGNPFRTAVRKAIGFAGLLVLITGFAINLDVSLRSGIVEQHASFWFVTSIVLGSLIFISLAYVLVGPWYGRRRRRHFAKLAAELIEQQEAGQLNPLQLYNGLLSHVNDLPDQYEHMVTQLYSEKYVFTNIVPATGQLLPADRARYVDAVVVRKKDSFTAELNTLREYLQVLTVDGRGGR